MKNSLRILFAVALLAFASCEICTECTYEFNGTTFEDGEFCGTSDEVQNYEDEIKTEAESVGVTATCVRL